MATGGGDLSATFKTFASACNCSEATTKDMTKWLKDAKIFGTKCNSNHLDICFSKVKPKGKRNITIKELDPLIVELAKMYKLDKKLGDDATAVQRIKTDMAGANKQTHGTTKTSSVGGVDRMTDTSKYTGAHKQRFDEGGKGKGMAGREELADGSGYVQGYKEKDTYAKKK